MELTNELRLAIPIEEAWAALTDLERVAPCMPGAQLQEVEGDEYRGIVKVKVGAISAQYKGTARLIERDDQSHRAVLQASGRDTRGQGNATARVTAVLAEAPGGGTTVSLVTDLSITGKVAQFGRSVLSDVSGKLLGQFAQQLESTLQSTGGEPAAGGTGTGTGTGTGQRTTDGTSTPDRTNTGQSTTGQSTTGQSTTSESTPDRTSTSESTTGQSNTTDRTGTTDGTGTGNGTSTGAGGAATSTPGDQTAPKVRVISAPEATPVDLLEVAGPTVLKRVAPFVALAAVVVAAVWRRYQRGRGRA